MNAETKKPGQDAIQGGLELGISKELSEQEMLDSTRLIFDEFVMTALPTLFTMVANGEGKQKLDAVGGRPGEKRSLIDYTAHLLFASIIKKHVKAGLPCAILSEEDIDFSSLKEAKKFLVFTDDPIDNSSPYAKGVKGAGVYSVKSAFDQDGKVIMGLSIDIENASIVVSRDGKNYLQKFEMVEKPNGDPKRKEFEFKIDENTKKIKMTEEEIFPSKRKTLVDPDATFYSFMGESKWGKSAIDKFLPKLYDVSDSKAHFELSRGGSHLYPFFLAKGQGEVYAISEEPFSEIFTAWAPIVNAKLSVWDVREDGSILEVKFDPRKFIENPKLYEEGYVGFFIVAVTPEIAREVADSYFKQLKESKTIKEKIEFADSRPIEEFEIFRASKQTNAAANN
jgi:hypothetical protein